MALTPWQQYYVTNAQRRQLLPEDVIAETQNYTPEIQQQAANFASSLTYPTGIPEAERVAREAEAAAARGETYNNPAVKAAIDKATASLGTLDATGSNVHDVKLTGTVQGLFDQYAAGGYNIDRINRIMAASGYSGGQLPETMAQLLAFTGQNAIDAGRTQALDTWAQNEYNMAKSYQLSSKDLATKYNLAGLRVTEDEINTIIKAAGLDPLSGRKPFGEPGATAPFDSLPPEYDGGLAGRQPDGLGMYGGTNGNGKPANVYGEMPRHPQLTAVMRMARRRAAPGYQGQSDTILTGSRGASGPLMLSRRKLVGV